MRRAGDVCFSQVYRKSSGNLLISKMISKDYCFSCCSELAFKDKGLSAFDLIKFL